MPQGLSKRAFRTTASYEAEKKTRDLVFLFLKDRYPKVTEERPRHGNTRSQLITATDSAGVRIKMSVRLCWRKERDAEDTGSAAQILSKVRNEDWEGSLQDKIDRETAAGVTHFLFVQRQGDAIISAALIPVHALLPIWRDQRDQSNDLIASGRLGRRKKNHAMNGSSPTLWLHDPTAPEVTAALWDYAGVQDLAKQPLSPVDDTYDDLPLSDYSVIGTDGALRITTTASHVKRDHRVRKTVLELTNGKCELCGTSRAFSGFLDVHHILGAETSDRVWTCVALCPNCHREAHTSPENEKINIGLGEMAKSRHPRAR